MSDKIYADGLRVGRREGAPEFKICELGVNVASFTAFLKQHEKQSGWVNIDILKSKGGKYYAELDMWEPKQRVTNEEAREAIEGEISSDEPF